MKEESDEEDSLCTSKTPGTGEPADRRVDQTPRIIPLTRHILAWEEEHTRNLVGQFMKKARH